MKIFCGSLPFNLEETELREFFEEYGEVNSAVIITDKFSGRSKGFGFVEMPDDEQANKAIAELNGSQVSGRSIVVNKAQERSESDRGRSNRGDSRGGGFNKGRSERW